jgi:cupin fold WbuC family metalloprotein
MEARRIQDDVYVADGPVVTLTPRDVDRLKALAGVTPRRRARLCAHRATTDAIHEMLIVLDAATYVRPHRHRNKSESFHVVEGSMSVVLFGEDGQVRRAIHLGDYASGRPFYYRLAEPTYHTVLVESSVAVIHETTNGPFSRAETEFAPWAPADEDAEAGRRYLLEVRRILGAETWGGAPSRT